MPARQLVIEQRPTLRQPRLVLALSGWMDGGDVSTGTIEGLAASVQAQRLAHIDSDEFYIFNFPGSMEISALFRPPTVIEEGLVKSLEYPINDFFFDPARELILFSGKEPNLRWTEFGDCIFELAAEFGVQRIYFVGSVAGTTPHTREPRLFCSASDEAMRDELARLGVGFSNYEGPASFITHLLHQAPRRGVRMASLVAEIPAYVEGTNPVCIESVTRRLAAMLGISVDLGALRQASDEFEKKLTDMVKQKPELMEMVQKLETAYDSEVFDTQMDDLKQWLQQRGVQLD